MQASVEQMPAQGRAPHRQQIVLQDVMARTSAMVRGREAFACQKWKEAYAHFAAADREQPLEPVDLESFATAAWLVGEEARAATIWTRAHHQYVDQGNVERAARLGFWLSLSLLIAGEMARCTGWLARSERLLRMREEACVEQGYGLIVTGQLAMGKGNARDAGGAFDRALALAEQFGDPDLLALALLSKGESLIRSNNISEGVARLDEAMVAATSEEVSPVQTGIIYCAVILACQGIFDLRRAREWTSQLDAWCVAQPDLVPFRGQCLVHRSEVLQLRGDWPEALSEVVKAREHLADRSGAVLGRACYQQGELHRLRGEFHQAGQMYREAVSNGCEPQPGLSLLLMAEGKPEAAVTALRGILESAGGRQGPRAGSSRPGLLPPYVELLVATGDLVGASAAADELARIAAASAAPFLLAASAQATGSVLLAGGEVKAALAHLREALATWQELDLPYECARVRVLIARTCQELADHETARLHLDAAHAVFGQLGAAPDLIELERLRAGQDLGPLGSLTDREREVLSLVAAGETNRKIAAALGISEHTVARHLSNIFDKLGVASRTAASVFAHKHKLV